VNLDGAHKVMGVGQRLIAGAAHVGGVVVVDDAEAINRVLAPVYGELAIDWDPAATGALSTPGQEVGWNDAMDAITAAFRNRHELVSEPIPERLKARAEEFVALHVAPG
jgi:hypothetical protein